MTAQVSDLSDFQQLMMGDGFDPYEDYTTLDEWGICLMEEELFDDYEEVANEQESMGLSFNP